MAQRQQVHTDEKMASEPTRDPAPISAHGTKIMQQKDPLRGHSRKKNAQLHPLSWQVLDISTGLFASSGFFWLKVSPNFIRKMHALIHHSMYMDISLAFVNFVSD